VIDMMRLLCGGVWQHDIGLVCVLCRDVAAWHNYGLYTVWRFGSIS